jgi:3-oxoacyl-[acyl-carrier-protein] synthase II
MSSRVVVTGLGVVSSIGIGRDEFADALRAGRSGARPITVFDTEGFEHTLGCEVAGFDPRPWIHRVDPAELGRASGFSIAASRMAVADAGLTEDDLRARRGLICIGTTDGESYDLDQLVEIEVNHGPEAMDPVRARRSTATRLTAGVAQDLDLTDVEALTVATACSAGNYAIGNGFDAVRTGEAEYALVGGADAMCRKTFAGFYRLGTVAPDCCRPFDSERKGILTGEGAGVLVLEPMESALRRGAPIYAEVLGYALNCDAKHPVAPDRESIKECIELALRNAGVEPHEVDLISAHGTGTPANDVTETGAIRDVYGEKTPPTVSFKSMLGHTMGAASALAAIACGLGITHRFIPPTINHRETDPECAVDCVPNQARDAELKIVQNNGMAFGGNNAVVVLGRFDEEVAR